MVELTDRTVLYSPALTRFERDGFYFFIDGGAPNWIATDRRGADILDLIDGSQSMGEIVHEYAKLQPRSEMDGARAWLHVQSFVREAVRHGILSLRPFPRSLYYGRSAYLKPTQLREFWFHTNNSCNLSCAHCLVESHPGGDPGLSTDRLKTLIDEVSDLGVERFYFTGGEPFVREDIFELIEYITQVKETDLILLTNATLFRGDRLDRLKRQNRRRLKLQVSLDGSTPDINDPIRGEGTFRLITEGLKAAGELGFETSLTAAVTGTNLHDIVNLPSLAKSLGAKSLHLMWLHRRGRALDLFKDRFPDYDQMLLLAREIKKRSDALDLVFDNYESLKLRVNGRPGVKFDLGNACWDSLCLGSNGHLYPSASFSGHAPTDMGDTAVHSIKELSRSSTNPDWMAILIGSSRGAGTSNTVTSMPSDGPAPEPFLPRIPITSFTAICHRM